MPRCKNCYYCNVCSLAKTYESENFLIGYQELIEHCEKFKDKSLIIELTHRVGDIVYEISNGEIYSLIILNIAITDNSIEFNCMEIDEECIDAYGDVDFGVGRSFSISDINKTVFINREDAEKGINND